MRMFANRIAIRICTFSGIVSFLITGYGFYDSMTSFQGTIVEFVLYFIDAFTESMINFTLTFTICGIVTFPVLKFIESKMIAFEKEKQKSAGPKK